MRKIIHVDMDCFYAAVEMRDNPALRHIPIAVGGPADQRGVISTANYHARRFGVRSAMSTAQAYKLCPHLKVVTGRMVVYKEIAQSIYKIFQRYTKIIEPLSLDEAYLDVTHSLQLYGSATLIAEDIRRTIFSELGLIASAGVAPIKFLAKVASNINKPNGQYVIEPGEISAFLRQLPLSEVPGVGKVMERKLSELGLTHCIDIQQYGLNPLLQRFGKFGRILFERCNGIDLREVCCDRQRKSVSVETTLTHDIHDWSCSTKILETLYLELETRLRRIKPDLRIARQGVKYKFDDFILTTQEHIWHQLDKDDLLSIAHQLWQSRRENRGVRLIGLHVTLIDPQIERQLSLEF